MKIYTLLCCVVMLLLCNMVFAQKNLVSNGNFEDGLAEWNGNSAKITPWDHVQGKNSCALIVYNTTNWTGIDQVVRIPKNAQGLSISAWIKTINVIKGNDEWMGAIYSIEFLDKADKKIVDGVNIARLTGDHEWEQVSKAVKIPERAVSFKIMLAMGYASGTMLIDDVQATVLNAEEVAKL